MTMPITVIQSSNSTRVLSAAYAKLQNTISEAENREPALLLVFPPAWNNRYQVLLYKSAGVRGYAVLGVTGTEILSSVSWPGPIIFHAHWFAGLFKDCETESEAVSRFQAMCADIEAFKSRTNAKLVWTAHNVFPHGNKFPQVFSNLRRWIFEKFDAVHVMNEKHIGILEDAYQAEAPAFFVVPHMLYKNTHANCVTQEEARAYYGISAEAFVFSYLGSIQPYKNLNEFLDVFDRVRLTSDREVVALIGGVPSDFNTVTELIRRWGTNPNVLLRMEIIPDHEIQYIHHAADVMVIPYGDTLNSGAAYMAASFGKTFVIPDCTAADSLDGVGAIRYNTLMENGLEEAMRSALNGARGVVTNELLLNLDPRSISNKFIGFLDSLID